MRRSATAVALTGAVRADVPSCCRDCVFWQTLRAATDARRKLRWMDDFEGRHGAWGRVLFDGDAFLGLLQYGPSSAFPRARTMPAGPPSAEGALLTCAFLAESDPAGTLERLLLEALADLKTRGFATVDAFAIGPVGTEAVDAVLAEQHTLLDRGTLERIGFRPTRARGPVTLMRLELRALEEAADPPRRAVEPGPRPATTPG